MSVISADKFRRFIEDVKPSAAIEGIPMSLLSRQQYVLRCGIVWLIDHAMSEDGMSNGQKLRVARDLSHPEVESQPLRWAIQFEAKSEELGKGSVHMGLIYALAGDLCAMVTKQPEGDRATATDGNGDVTFDDEVAA